MTMVSATQVLLAFMVDLLIGDPAWLPHPVRLIGRAISTGERALRRLCSSPEGERLAGVVLVFGIVGSTYLAGAFTAELLSGLVHPAAAGLGSAALIYFISTTIASRELLRSAHRVIAAVRDGDLKGGRQHVSMIVGRDTAELSEQGVLKATIETLAENLSDGVVAPLLYLAIGGLPLALAYKAVNTLDSMVGYKNDRYRHFGWAAARLDDAANFVPARLSGLIIVASAFLYTLTQNSRGALDAARSAFLIMVRDGRKHPSPNSGVSEAAMAGALGVRLGGPSSYGGMVSAKPFIGQEAGTDYLAAAQRALVLVALSSAVAAGVAAGVAAVRGLL